MRKEKEVLCCFRCRFFGLEKSLFLICMVIKHLRKGRYFEGWKNLKKKNYEEESSEQSWYCYRETLSKGGKPQNSKGEKLWMFDDESLLRIIFTWLSNVQWILKGDLVKFLRYPKIKKKRFCVVKYLFLLFTKNLLKNGKGAVCELI